MKQEDTRRFPQRRNGVHHPKFGYGVVELAPHNVGGGTCLVKFVEAQNPIWVDPNELSSAPAYGVSPDPKLSRNSGYVGVSGYRRK